MKKCLLLFSFCALGTIAYSQSFKPDDIRSGSLADINYLAKGYLTPGAKAFGMALNNGWYSTAKPHNLGRFDIMVTPTFMIVPTPDQTFLIENSKMKQLELVNGTSAEAPTVFGSNAPGPALRLKNDLGLGSLFNSPGGTGISFFPALLGQASVGLFKNTNLSIRYMPTMGIIGLKEGEVGMWGFGIKHDVFQWVPGLDKFPLDASVFFGYSSLTYTQGLDDGSGHEDQEMEIKANSWTARFLLSKKLLFITPYAGFGYNSGSTDVSLNGTYVYNTELIGVNVAQSTIKDPVSFTTDTGGFVGNLGVRFKFLFVMSATVDYTFGEYDALTIGLGVSVDF